LASSAPVELKYHFNRAFLSRNMSLKLIDLNKVFSLFKPNLESILSHVITCSQQRWYVDFMLGDNLPLTKLLCQF